MKRMSRDVEFAELIDLLSAELTLRTDSLASQLTFISNQLHTLRQEVIRMSGTIDTNLTQLKSDVAALTGVVTSAEALISGFAQQLAAAISAAQNQGATPEELQAFNDLHNSLTAETQSLAQAVEANPLPAEGGGAATGSDGVPTGGTVTPPVGDGSTPNP